MKSCTHGAAWGKYTLCASTSPETAWARASFPPSGSTAMMPEISCFKVSMTAVPFALSSTRLRWALGPLRVQRAECGDGGAEAEVPADLIEQEFIGAFAAPHLAHDVVGT